MASDQPNPESIRLSETETRVLQLYDNLVQLQLELALVRAQQDGASHPYSGTVVVLINTFQLLHPQLLGPMQARPARKIF